MLGTLEWGPAEGQGGSFESFDQRTHRLTGEIWSGPSIVRVNP